jgi:hypothetical protein
MMADSACKIPVICYPQRVPNEVNKMSTTSVHPVIQAYRERTNANNATLTPEHVIDLVKNLDPYSVLIIRNNPEIAERAIEILLTKLAEKGCN